jgi:Sigma-70 region 2
MTEEEFDELRPSAFAIAHRMLGSVSEAEDVVQEGFLRLHRARAGGERIESPRFYLILLESLTPEQRAAFLLRDVFDEPYGLDLAVRDVEGHNGDQLELAVEEQRTGLPYAESATRTSCGSWGRLPTWARCCASAPSGAALERERPPRGGFFLREHSAAALRDTACCS